MMGGLEQSFAVMAMKLASIYQVAFFAPILVIMYFYLVWDAKKSDSKDTQIGIKTVLATLALLGVALAAGGVSSFLWYILGKMGGAHLGTELIKASVGSIIAGGAAVGASAMLMQRTNLKEFPKATRVTLGAIAGLFSLAAFTALSSLFDGILMSAGWEMNSLALAGVVTYGGIGFLSLTRLGGMSGWTTPPPRPQMPMGYPPQGGGYPPQQGMPPQGGGYPPQGGGYPPQGGGYPPQGGGYPPQGQGGGLPPPSGGYPPGGYPPR